MPKVIYNGNGSGGGTVPVDSTNYAVGSTVNVAGNTGNLTRSGAVFLYWNTAANGSGTIYGGGSSFTFPNQPGNLTLYAQWGVTTGLTGGGATAHYAFYYDESLGGPGGVEPARINSLLAKSGSGNPVCEDDFNWMQAQFAGVNISNGISLPIPAYVTARGGWSASWWPLYLNPGTTAPATSLRAAMVMEVVEMFMKAQHKGWGYSAGVGDEESCGEALSQFLTVQFQTSIGLGGSPANYGSSNQWLHTSLPASNPASTEFDATGQFGGPSTGTHYGARADYVNATKPWPGNGPATGCSLLFIYYLSQQLGFPASSIVGAAPGLDSSNNLIGGSCLRGVYRNLTGDTSDPFPYFASLLAAAYAPDQVASIPGPNADNPWPLGSLSFVGAKNTWGKDEIKDIIAKGGTYPDGFYLALDGFSLNVLGSVRPSIPTIAFTGATTALSTTPPTIYYQSTNPAVPQQILFAYDVKFAKPLGTFPAKGETPAEVDSFITLLSQQFKAKTEFFFTAGADPYFTNVVPSDPAHPTQLNVPWLSEDLRVFTATPGAPPAAQYQYPVPGPGAPKFVENSVGGAFDVNSAYAYVQALLKHLNAAYGDPSGTDPFNPASNVIPQQQTEFTADSSVTPFTVIGGHNYNNYSFAIARVRLKGIAAATVANGVKVFFRLWGTQSADTGWDPTYTYLSNNDGAGNPQWPEAPADNHTIPFFATSAQPNFADPNDPEFKTGGTTGTGANNQKITIQQGDSQWAYFGCLLNVNDPSVQVNGTPIWQAFPGTHHCLVAQIAYAGTPIQTVNGIVPTPEGSNLLAQRNLQVTTSDNPGPPSSHRVPQTFDVKPSAPPPATGPLAGRPDELMILWGDVPPGSTAQIYWPGASSAEVIKLASWMYGVHPLTAADANTIEVKTIKGATYVPIPQGTGPSLPGLFTVDLPQTVKTGQEFNIVVRRIGKRLRRASPPPPPTPAAPKIAAVGRVSRGRRAAEKPMGPMLLQNAAVAEMPVYERYIVGSFQVKIPVSTREAMLPAEETTLAILKARLEGMPATSPWYPVLLRYVGQIAGRVDGLGGNAGAIPPSLGGYRPTRLPCTREHRKEFTGKVVGITYDRFGDFLGFILDTEDGNRRFTAREPEIERVVHRAWAERILTTIIVELDAPHRPEEIVLHCPPKPFTE